MSELNLWGKKTKQETVKPVKPPKIDLSKKANQPYAIGQKVWYQDGNYPEDEPEEVEVLGYTRVSVKIQRFANMQGKIRPVGIPCFVKLDELSVEKPESK